MITSNKIKRHEKRYIVLYNKIFNIPLKNLCNSTTNDITINKSKFNRQFITVASMTQGHIYYRLQGLQLTFIFLAKLFLSKLHFRGYLFLLALIPLFQIDSNPSSDSEFTLRGKYSSKIAMLFQIHILTLMLNVMNLNTISNHNPVLLSYLPQRYRNNAIFILCFQLRAKNVLGYYYCTTFMFYF